MTRRSAWLIPLMAVFLPGTIVATFFSVRASEWVNAPARDDSVATIHAQAGDLLEVAFSADGTSVATGGWGETVTIWDARSLQRRHTLTGHTDRIMGLAFSLDSQLLISGSKDATARIWNPQTSELVGIFRGHRDRVRAISFHQGDLVATGSRDGTIKVWHARSLELVASLAPRRGFVTAVAFHPDGSSMTFGTSDGTLGTWNIRQDSYRTIRDAHGGIHAIVR